ncbi:Ovate protein family, C-terminal [Parasponia andersonii]|uniref:Transcription repressor n=1 Tax=Parasponia andersonii TaxID=3476 RepID=A0A2P5BPA9_PARAD|nr:Ovate protein family, C-terminal [Parasponia andersonii]
MENRFRLKLSRMFRGSFGSCRTRNLSDVIDKSVLRPEENQSFHMVEPNNVPTKVRPFPSICGPNWSGPAQQIDTSCIMSTMDVMLPRAKLSERVSPFFKVDSYGGRRCPPASPVFPPNPFYELRSSNFRQRKSKNSAKMKSKRKMTKTQKSHKGRDYFAPFSSSSLDSNHSGLWFSSDDDDDKGEGQNCDVREDETDNLFSSRSLSSDSSEPRRRRRNRWNGEPDRRRRASSEVGLVPLQGRVKDSFAVVKKSSDPHNDFRTSMVEMIVEKQIFAAKDLEQLLQCFLSLNSDHHHKVIVEVFTEILEALFSNWGS